MIPGCEPTLCKAILLAEKIVREQGSGKISLINIFDRYCAEGFPFQSGRFYVAVWLSNFKGVPPMIDVTIRIEEAQSWHVMASARNHMEPKPDTPPIPQDAVLGLTFSFRSVTFPSPGTYSIVVLVNNEEMGKQPLIVSPLTQTT